LLPLKYIKLDTKTREDIDQNVIAVGWVVLDKFRANFIWEVHVDLLIFKSTLAHIS
jgi:hypothetical protein